MRRRRLSYLRLPHLEGRHISASRTWRLVISPPPTPGGSCHRPRRRRALGAVAGEPGAILSEGHQRKVVPVEVVAEIEVTREAGAREEALRPRAVGPLGADEPVDAALDGVALRSVGSEEAEERPRGLRGRALALPGETLVVVGGDRLAPAAVGVLVRTQPLDGTADVRRAQILADRGEADERAPRPVDEVDAPAAPPRAVLALRPAEELDG